MNHNKPTYEELLTEIENLNKRLADKKALEKELAKARILMQAAFDQSPVPLVVVTYPDFSFKIINQAMENFILANAQDYLNKTPFKVPVTWKDFNPNGILTNPLEAPLPLALKGITTKNKESYIVRYDGSIVWCLASAAPIYDDEKQLIGAIYAATDITERRETEQILKDNEKKLKEQNEEYEALNEELREANEQLQIAINKAEESDRLKTAFLQNISHEIRTPMNAIMGFSSFLNDPDLLLDKRRSFTSIIINSANQLLSVVTDILTISSLETKQEEVNIQKVDVNSIMVNLFSIFKIQAMNRNISMVLKQELPDDQSTVYSDETKVLQILTNLLTNAIKFTHQGFIEFGCEKIVETHGRASIQFYVKDTGIGIYKEQQEKIFERFRQADKSIQYNYGGTGLGLSISRGFVELMNGKIWVDSEIDKGSTFYFTIPYNPVENADKRDSTIKDNKNEITILVAEDEIYNFIYIQEILNGLGVNVLHTKNGHETVEICKSNPNIQIILMDIKMPIMDGHAAAQLIKRDRPGLPIIAQSAYALDHERERYSGFFDDYITKPIKAEELKHKLMKFIYR